MTTEFVSVPATWTVDDTLKHIRDVEHSRETIYVIYVVDPANRTLLRTATLQRLITGELQASVLSICPDHHPIVVTPMADREDVARLITKYDLLAIPVVDDSGYSSDVALSSSITISCNWHLMTSMPT
jgi:magnesium transporter